LVVQPVRDAVREFSPHVRVFHDVTGILGGFADTSVVVYVYFVPAFVAVIRDTGAHLEPISASI
jgi:hypothetical protein|tara:strand:+ start:1999 stop:2190 length:192 start_codon:yes stop_codon:yes gene_type:complete